MLASFPPVSPVAHFPSLKTVGDGQKVRESRPIDECMYRLECDALGADLLKSLEVDALVMEPTGGWYSGFWVDNCKRLGIPIYRVSHAPVKYSRRHYGFKNKDDRSDAFTIALLYFDPGNRDELGNPPFLRKDDHDGIERIRERVYEREQLDRNANTLINQLLNYGCD